MTNTELQKFTIKAYEQANLISGYSSYISYQDQISLIKLAKYYRKLLLLNTGDPAFIINCLNEDTNKLTNLNITRKHSLQKIILLLVAKDHYFTLQQIKKYAVQHEK